MTFREIESYHPYYAMLEGERPPAYEHFYRPDDAMWPIYGITFVRFNNGFNLSVSVKRAIDAWWETCEMYNPIPLELAPIIKELL